MELLGSFGDVGLSLAGTILAFLFVLTIIVFIHEMGHFLAARWCGMGVSTFSVGFGPELLGFTDRKGTRWKLSAIPLGGYVKFLGDENEASADRPQCARGDDTRGAEPHLCREERRRSRLCRRCRSGGEFRSRHRHLHGDAADFGALRGRAARSISSPRRSRRRGRLRARRCRHCRGRPLDRGIRRGRAAGRAEPGRAASVHHRPQRQHRRTDRDA